MSSFIAAAASAFADAMGGMVNTVALALEVRKAQELVARSNAIAHLKRMDRLNSERIAALDRLFDENPVLRREIMALRATRRAEARAYKANAAICKSRRRDNAIGATRLGRRRNLRLLRAISHSLNIRNAHP
jgi:hypothetical protein